MGCSNSKAEAPVKINKKPAVEEFDEHAKDKFGITLETQEKIKEYIHLVSQGQPTPKLDATPSPPTTTTHKGSAVAPLSPP